MYNAFNKLYTYPDISIVCGNEEYLDDGFDTLLNPTVLIEVLSPSTPSYDRGDKFMLYRSIPSLKNYILISSTGVMAEVFTRMNDDQWVLNVAQNIQDSIHISAIDYDLVLNDVYAQVEELTGNMPKSKK